MFTTETSSDTEILFAPENQETDVSTTTDITIEFASKIYRYGGGAVTQTYAEDNILLRKGSYGGTVVDAELVISDDGKTFTFIPDENLAINTYYYIVINRNAFQYEDDKIVPNKNVYFRTGTGVPVLSKFSLESAGATSAVFSVTSDTTGTLTLTATSRTGSPVTNSFPVTEGITKTVTLSGLAPETSYTVSAVVKSASGAQSVAKSVTASTTNAFAAKVTDVTDSGAMLKVDAYSAGKLTVTYKNVATSAEETVLTNIIVSAGKTRNVEISGLLPATEYEITAKFQCDGAGEEPIVVSEKITTKEAVDYLAISKILISDAVNTDNLYEAELDVENASAIAAIASTTSVKINVSAVTGAAITVDGKAAESGKYSAAVTVVPGEDKVVEIVVKHGEQTKTYQLTVSVGEE